MLNILLELQMNFFIEIILKKNNYDTKPSATPTLHH